MTERAFSDQELRALAFLAAEDYMASNTTLPRQEWRANRAAKDLRHVSWGTFGIAWSIYNRAFDEALACAGA